MFSSNFRKTIPYLSLAAVLALGCSNAPQTAKNDAKSNDVTTDAQIAGDVQTRISSDPDVRGRQISINVQKGAVTLTGTVGSNSEMMAALKDAQAAEGVKQVVSALQIESGATATTAAVPVPTPAAPVSRPRAKTFQPRRDPRHVAVSQYEAPAPALVSNNTPVVETAKMPIALPTPSVPEVVKINVPAGTELNIRTSESLSSETSRPDQIFHGILNSDVVVDDQVVIPAGADAEGRVVDVHSSTHYAGQAMLVLQLSKVSFGGKNYTVSTDQWTRKADARGSNTAKKVGAGTAIGAVLGGIFGGGKGAAIGAASGAGVGAGANTITKGKPVDLQSESLVVFRLASPVTVVPGTPNPRHGPRLTADNNSNR
ncbi:MAG: putative periplasmic or secreted lipoprotein [Acidobacteriales bacterium]|nr:putative periplasmic or secreted lipoprotein [Terriglobales bacterium]